MGQYSEWEPIADLIRRLIPGLDTRNQADKKLYDKLRALVPLESKELPGTSAGVTQDPRHEFTRVTDALSGRQPGVAGNILTQGLLAHAQQANKGPEPLPDAVQHDMWKTQQTEADLAKLYRPQDVPESVLEAEAQLENNELTKYMEAARRGRGPEDLAVANIPALDRYNQGLLDRGQAEHEQAMELQRQKALDRPVSNKYDMAIQHPEAFANLPENQPEAAENAQGEAFDNVLAKGAGADIVEARQYVTSPEFTDAASYIGRLDDVINDPELPKLFGQSGITRFFGTVVPGTARSDAEKRIDSVAGKEMLSAIQSFTGQISDKDLEWASKDAIDIISSPKSSPELVVKTLKEMKRILVEGSSNALSKAGLSTMEEYNQLIQASSQAGWSATPVQ